MTTLLAIKEEIVETENDGDVASLDSDDVRQKAL